MQFLRLSHLHFFACWLLAGWLLACSFDAVSVGSDGSTSTRTDSGPTELPTTTDAPDPPGTTSSETGETGETSETGELASMGESSEPSGGLSGCGDGVLDPGEQCDEGVATNAEGGSCLPSCLFNVCGDGFVRAGVEQCDLGPDNSHDFGGCVPGTCHFGPNCGDGVVTPGHELCDPGAPVDPMGDVVPCTPTCRFSGRVVFISSTVHDGALNGVSGADLVCQGLAMTFDPEHHHAYRAWLSDDVSEPASTFDHEPGTPYVLLSGVPVAADFASLVQAGPNVGITITDTYQAVFNERVWTHTTHAGEAIPGDHHCAQWTANSFKTSAQIGLNAVLADSPDLQAWHDERWWTRFEANELTCDLKLRLYCFED